jgi:hypothetical protein
MPETVKTEARGAILLIGCEKEAEWYCGRTLRVDRYRPKVNASTGELE